MRQILTVIFSLTLAGLAVSAAVREWGLPEHAPAVAAQEAGASEGRPAPERAGKKKKPKTPTCFGLKATIKDHKGEITGTSGDDVIIGDAGPNRIFVNTDAQNGVDRVCAGGGDDFITMECCDGVLIAAGGAGNDFLLGGIGSDVLFGGDGDDQVDSGPPDDDRGDLLLGERGVDTFFGDGQNDTCQQNLNGDPVPC